MQRYHDRVARRYDASYEDEYWQWHDALTWDYLKPYLPTDQSIPVLDLGCGTGKWAARLLKSGYTVTCVDISAAMLAQARAKIEEMGPAARAEFHQADLCDLSGLPAESYALALALGEPIGCTASPPRALKEVRRRLQPEGILVATLDNRLAAIDYYLQSGEVDGLAGFLKTGRTHWLTKSQDERFDIHTYTPEQAARLFDQAGFEVLSVIGKTVLPMRNYRPLLADATDRRRWMDLEKSLSRHADAVGRAAHLQIAARVRGE